MRFVSILLGSVLLLNPLNSPAQDDRPQSWSSAYAEVFGIAGWYLLNYEYRNNWWAMRVGTSVWNGQEGYVLALPVSAMVIIDPASARTLEFGVGYVPSWGERSYDRNGSGHAPENLELYRFDHWPAFQFGYRSQPGPGRFLFRANLTVLNVSDIRELRGIYPLPDVHLWFGASIGYTIDND
ncbi:MAG: hypothetical protein JNL52_00930 [Flavobacteriales bacterium]|nr:hypothetical protein [Flavobacteriales bacterium]